MNEIICACGHGIKRHHAFGGCHEPFVTIDEQINTSKDCKCNLSPETVEARYYAKYFYKEFTMVDNALNYWLEEYYKLVDKLFVSVDDCKLLKKELKKAMKALDKIGRKTDDTKIAGIAYDAMGNITIMEEKNKLEKEK